MLIIRDLESVAQITDPGICQIVQKRIHDLGDYDPDELGYFLVIEAGDTIDAINTQLGFPILCNRSTGIHYGAAGFTPSFEFMEEYASCYDTVFVLSDDGYGIEVFIPKVAGIEPELLAMCARFATPAPTEESEP